MVINRTSYTYYLCNNITLNINLLIYELICQNREEVFKENCDKIFNIKLNSYKYLTLS